MRSTSRYTVSVSLSDYLGCCLHSTKSRYTQTSQGLLPRNRINIFAPRYYYCYTFRRHNSTRRGHGSSPRSSTAVGEQQHSTILLFPISTTFWRRCRGSGGGTGGYAIPFAPSSTGDGIHTTTSRVEMVGATTAASVPGGCSRRRKSGRKLNGSLVFGEAPAVEATTKKRDVISINLPGHIPFRIPQFPGKSPSLLQFSLSRTFPLCMEAGRTGSLLSASLTDWLLDVPHLYWEHKSCARDRNKRLASLTDCLDKNNTELQFIFTDSIEGGVR